MCSQRWGVPRRPACSRATTSTSRPASWPTCSPRRPRCAAEAMAALLAGIEGLLLVASALLLIPLAVLTVQVVAAVGPGRRSDASAVLNTPPRPSIAVLMPAHDEAAGIAPVIAAVRARLGPHDRL